MPVMLNPVGVAWDRLVADHARFATLRATIRVLERLMHYAEVGILITRRSPYSTLSVNLSKSHPF